LSIKKNRITVAIPVRNGSDYLAETLGLLHNAPISEILISNNFSTDNTENIIKDFQNVRIIKPPTPLKMAENWNFVTRHVSTEYFRLVSHDDLPKLESFEEHEKILDENPQVGMVFSRRSLIIQGRTLTKTLSVGKFNSRSYKSSQQLLEEVCRSGKNPCGETFAVTLRSDLFQNPRNNVAWFGDEPFELDTWLQISRLMNIVEAPIDGGGFRVHLNSHSGSIPNYFLQGKKVVSWAKIQPEYQGLGKKHRLTLILLINFRSFMRFLAFKFIKFF